MGVTVSANGLSVIHQGSGGVSLAFPDVCKTPSPGGPLPVPYPNQSKSSDTDQGSKTVKLDGNSVALKNSNFKTSTGDEPGRAGGVASSKTQGKSTFLAGSMNVKIEGQSVTRAMDLVLHNDKNTPPFPVLQPPLIALVEEVEAVCALCEKTL